jgi:hypothetical protein
MKTFATLAVLACAAASGDGVHFTDEAAHSATTLTTVAGAQATVHTAYCPIGYYVGTTVEDHEHTSFFTETGDESCLKCADGSTSAGGLTTECHVISTVWTTCTKMSCLAETAEHCQFHDALTLEKYSRAADGTKVACGTTNTGGSHAGKTRISVLHNGRENAGIQHQCKLTGTRADATRGCECLCRDQE